MTWLPEKTPASLGGNVVVIDPYDRERPTTLIQTMVAGKKGVFITANGEAPPGFLVCDPYSDTRVYKYMDADSALVEIHLRDGMPFGAHGGLNVRSLAWVFPQFIKNADFILFGNLRITLQLEKLADIIGGIGITSSVLETMQLQYPHDYIGYDCRQKMFFRLRLPALT